MILALLLLVRQFDFGGAEVFAARHLGLWRDGRHKNWQGEQKFKYVNKILKIENTVGIRMYVGEGETP